MPRQVSFSAADLFLGTTNGGIRSREFGGELGDFQDSEYLTFFHVGADIDANLFDIACHLGVNIDILKRLEFAGNRQGVPQVVALNTCYGGGDGGQIPKGVAGIVRFRWIAFEPAPPEKADSEKQGHSDQFISFLHS
jgi:hypothetical protein